MRLITMTVLTLLIAAIAGFGSAWRVLQDEPPAGAVRMGAWRAWPSMGGADIDPYARAIVQRSGLLPLGSGEGQTLVATTDDAGRPLDGGCAYEVVGPMPAARIWTLGVVPAYAGGPARAGSPGGEAPAEERHLTSETILRESNKPARVALAATAQPGDWLRTPATGPFRLVLRLYDTPSGLAARPRFAGVLAPSIRRGACR